MKYDNIVSARFIDRPNRFIANVEINSERHVCHVKNTGRCKELLTPGAELYLQESTNPNRKTAFDLIAVKKNDRIINMDSYAPNIVFGEYLSSGGMGFIPDMVKAEQKYEDSRFDFYFEYSGKKCYAEVKGVTLEADGIARFPDAPTERGIKHLKGLMEAVKRGYECYAVFIIQMKGIKYFEANRLTHPEFAHTLKEAANAGVNILALDCMVTPDSIFAADKIRIKL